MNNQNTQIHVFFMRGSLPPVFCGCKKVYQTNTIFFLRQYLISSIKGKVKKNTSLTTGKPCSWLLAHSNKKDVPPLKKRSYSNARLVVGMVFLGLRIGLGGAK